MNQIKSLLSKNINLKVRDTISAECFICNKTFLTTKRNLQIADKRNQTVLYCSQKCYRLDIINKKNIETMCETCEKIIIKRKSEILNHVFCSHSCAGKYSNLHKTMGTRRSKLEIWLEEQLKTKYPNLEFIFNGKETINSELDIYIPNLKLAFELNGIFHYEPIYGPEKLQSIQNNDDRKFQACLEKNIELCIIDSSKQSYFNKKSGQKYLDIITNLIDVRC